MKKAPAKQTLVRLYKSGKLLENIFERFHAFPGVDHDAVISRCASLHNAGSIDLLSLINETTLEDVSGPKFFVGQHFYCKVIRQLNGHSSEIMRCVQMLVKKGGNDGAANLPNGAFRDWCLADLTRAQEVIDAAKEGDRLACDHLTFALEAGNMVNEAKEFVEHFTDDRRISGVTALGRMKHLSPSEALGVLDLLLSVHSKKHTDQLSLNILMAALEIGSRYGLSYPARGVVSWSALPASISDRSSSPGRPVGRSSSPMLSRRSHSLCRIAHSHGRAC